MPHFPLDTGFQPSTEMPDEKHPSVQVKNRRKRYLDQHPEYFSAELELAGPLALFPIAAHLHHLEFRSKLESSAEEKNRSFS